MDIILVEDDPLILVCTGDALRDAGFEVGTAFDATEALALLTRFPGCRAMMIDVRLREGVDGWEVARRARRIKPDLTIIYTTTADGPEFGRNSVSDAILLQKPYTIEAAVRTARDNMRDH